MLIKLRFRFPEVFFGALLAVALFALGATFWSSQNSSPTTQAPGAAHRAEEQDQRQQHEGLWDWITHDAAGFFTGWVVVVGGGQLVLFYVQLKLIRESLTDAEKASKAAEVASKAAERQAKVAEATLAQLERPYIFIFDVKEFGFDPEAAKFFVEYSIANYGKMPAIIEGAYIGFEFSDRGAPPRPTLMWDDHTLMTAPILQVGEKREKIREYLANDLTTGSIEVDPTSPDPFKITRAYGPVFDVPEGNQVFFRAVVEYRGPFSRGHSTGALWLTNYPSAGQLAQRGGDAYNYIK